MSVSFADWSARIHFETVKNLFVESSEKKGNWLRNPLTNKIVESSDKKGQHGCKTTEKQWNPVSFCFYASQI